MAPTIKSIQNANEDDNRDRKAVSLTPHPGDEALLHVKKQWVDQLTQYAQMKGYTAVLQGSFPPSVISLGPRSLLKTPLEIHNEAVAAATAAGATPLHLIRR